MSTAGRDAEDVPTIVFVAFGTSVPEARKVFAFIEKRAAERYPGHAIRWAFTSSFIRRKLAKNSIVTQSPQEVVGELAAREGASAVFQSLHVVPGQEFTHKVLPLADEAPGLAVGTPLLTEDSDIERTIDALAAAHPTISDPSVANVVVAHGNERHPEFAERILALATRIHGRYPNVFVASVEGEPGTAPLEEARVWAQQSGHVHFVPLMVVAGDHVLNDVMGDEEDSWKQVVAAPKVTCGQPLGYLSAICDVFFDHLDDAIRRLAGRDAAR